MKQTGSRKWILGFFAAALIMLLLVSVLAYAVDPFFQFRVRDNSYLLNSWFVSSGLIENYDYDTLIIGSSMVQCFEMDDFRNKLGAKPLHVGLGGINQEEISRLTNLAYDTPQASRFYICVDLAFFTGNSEGNRYPEYLLNRDLLSRLRYLLSYEVCFRYVPVDLGLMAADRLGIRLPDKIEYSRSVDRLEDWRLDFPEVGKEAVLENYRNDRYSVSKVNLSGLSETMIANIDEFLASFDYERGKHVFFFPPYSSLFWCDAQESGYYSVYLQGKQYFIEKAEQYGAEVYDFQSDDLTTDLENYKDLTHYLPAVNSWMVDCFASGEYLVSTENEALYREKLTENTNRFREEYAYLFDN